ncbi:thiol:disulfide interchange protein DsbA/DsbL [Xanthomonadaceae bacterium JHOS43]|nr:thiol:disulfide interchange protein DsbA/DsbL [Xanthomonadaceae bacterium JHOS43]
MFHRLVSLFLLAFVACAGTVHAQPAAPVEGQDYTLIDPAVPTLSGDRIEVVEVFGYSCVHCATFAPVISAWKKKQPDDVRVEYVPAVFGGIWEVYGRVFYTAETMGVLDLTHDALFEALHTERRPVNKIEDIADFYAEHGVDKEQFLATLDSFPVNAKLAKARERAMGWGIDATPTMIVAGKYKVMAPRHGGFERMLEIVDALVERERTPPATKAE